MSASTLTLLARHIERRESEWIRAASHLHTLCARRNVARQLDDVMRNSVSSERLAAELEDLDRRIDRARLRSARIRGRLLRYVRLYTADLEHHHWCMSL